MSRIIEVDLVRMNVSGYEFVAKRGLYNATDSHATVIGSGTALIEMVSNPASELEGLERMLAELTEKQAAESAVILYKINKIKGDAI